MEVKKFQDIQLSRLGMGNMRLPGVEGSNDPNAIDYKKAHEIIDYAYNHGINYFDSAYVYNNGESEKCVGECMKKYPRDSFYLATKFFIGATTDYKAVFAEQLERLQTDHIDFYLIHCVMDGNCDQYLESGAIEYFLKMKEEGKISYLGFSSHASPAYLEKMANHHQWDFAQLQLNYFDWCYGTTKEEYKILEERHIPIMVMEPVRGGKLAKLNEQAHAMLKGIHSDWSDASWALRFVRHLPQVQVILSGMSTMDQIVDNVKTFDDDSTFTNEDFNILMKACDSFHKQIVVPCTACRYCCDGCPMQINIPEFLKVYNAYKVDGYFNKAMYDAVDSIGKPADCIGCGACTGHCPQSIDVPNIMPQIAQLVK